MPDSNLSLFPHVINPQRPFRRGGKHLGPIHRRQIMAMLRNAWGRGETPVPKSLGFDVGIHPAQVCRHLRKLEDAGLLVRRRAGLMIFVEAPQS